MKPPNKPLRTRAIGSPSPCCAPIGGMFEADPDSDCFFCSKCHRLYTLDEVLDDVLDIAAKPQARPSGGVTTAPRPKMVPLSRTLQTFQVKEDLKAIGARWDHINKQWMVPEDKFQEAHHICQRGAKNVQHPPPNAPFTASRFAGLDTSDLDADAFMDMTWDRWAKQQHKNPVPAKPVTVNKRLCWECGKSFDENAFGSKGVWDDFWCGCEGR